MSEIKGMSRIEVAACVATHLRLNGIEVVLSGGACVAIHRNVEFPAGPLAVGDEPIRTVDEIRVRTGIVRLLSPTDCVKDRLAGYYHWNDLQCLEQAKLVADSCEIDLGEIERWSKVEWK